MLALEGVHAHYGLSHVLQGVSLTIAKGEVVGVFGRNGVGKTTLVKTIAGWVKPTSGAIRFDGKEIGGLASDRICRQGVGLVPEDRRVFPGLTVEENLRLGLMQSPGRSRAECNQAIERIFARFARLAERRSQMGTTLSGGEQQMLAIARVLAGTPRLLLIDEPTEGLAPMIVDEIFALIAELRTEGIPVLLVEQNVMRALEVCDRFVALERGAIVFEGSARVAADREKLIAAIAV
jgi:branched-chain amino acid transport system ATP-binding protein